MATIDWRKFDSGSGVLRALASGDVQIGNIGSSRPLAVAASQKLPIEVFFIAAQLGSAEALVVTNSINSAQGLIGKRIVVPFISTAYYSLLASLKHWDIKPEQVKFSTCSRQPSPLPGNAVILIVPTSEHPWSTNWSSKVRCWPIRNKWDGGGTNVRCFGGAQGFR